MSSNKFIQQFINATQDGLPGERAHADLMPVNRPFTSDAFKAATDYRKSAVGIVLFEEQSYIKCVLIQRPKYEGVHGNQVSFPGGKMDATDPDLEFTARRECMEEIALQPEYMSTVGQLSEVFIPVSKFLVQPYVFFVDDMPQLIPDDREVDEIFTFNVDNLLDESVLKATDMRFKNGFVQKNIPYFDLEGRTVWGATAMMLSEFKAIMKSF